MLYIIPRGRWCHIIVLDVHAPTEDKIDIKDRFYKELEHIFSKFTKYNVKISLGYFSATVGREDIFKPTAGNESLHESSNVNGVTSSKFCHNQKRTVFPHSNIDKCTWTSPDAKMRNQIDHIMIDRR
jgi:hypothetical protein